MEQNEHKNLWKIEIMAGKYPAQTFAFKIITMQREVILFFNLIDKVVLNGLNKKEIISKLSSYPYISQILYEKIIKMYNVTRKKVKIIYELNNKLKFDIIEDKNEIIVRIPSEENTPF